MIGARDDNKIYVKTEVTIEPDIPEVRPRLLFRLVKINPQKTKRVKRHALAPIDLHRV